MLGEVTRGFLRCGGILEALALHRIEHLRSSKKIERAVAPVPRNDSGGSAANLDYIGVGHFGGPFSFAQGNNTLKL
ncbi:hypothetical protein [Methylocella silvestris]|uniref:hypothetical protein n=1 Tax=Methylocella silvestris TaxID=199596 RepID=UPI0003042743|nr:hypothetical protein [Methylocella silvestris]